ncbi:hypothetical protein [Paenibacillus mendelii]|uniref:DUF4352 domain-containing protein n=1 Tax=Paenibacillus mendelii TaxID=206163 RepID=A0ABV6JDG1_9BACL|nr:hypothetical protein [Paenibacillus mendelii]MCQ6563550.1 hypothetical protein [Paenibacillus mendelii]
MNNKTSIYLMSALIVLLLTSACGAQSNAGSPADTVNTKPAETSQGNTAVNEDDSTGEDKKILIIIDQTPKPIEGNSFDFAVNQLPEGYALTEMQWISEKSKVANTVQEAIEHGANGEDGFYISGDGQFSGFFYPDSMKGEEGQVIFLFKDDQGNELSWKKKITLK